MGEGTGDQVMDETSDTRQRLSTRIEEKQRAIRAYLGRERPRRTRLANTSIVGSALAAAFTAGPAVGGTGFTNSVAELFNLSDDSVVWRGLCLLAVICSVAAALATNFATSHSLADRVSAAETCSAQLEGLQVALNFGHIEIEEAVKLYQQYATQVAFVEA
jgi:MFS family permease